MINHDKLKNSRAGNRQTKGWKCQDGPNKVRLLPPGSRFLGNWELLEDLAVKYNKHFIRVTDGKAPEVTRCYEDLGKKCIVCDAWRANRKSEDPAVKEVAKGLGPAGQYMFNIMDLSNIPGGVQLWEANYTCWDKIMEIAANPSWGNVVDPANGIDFTVTLTPGNRNKTGHNQYSVVPDPGRTNIMGILATMPGWETLLDGLEGQMAACRDVGELRGILAEMGFSVGGAAYAIAAPAVAAPSAPAAPSYAPAPVAAAPAAPVAYAPAPVAAAPAAMPAFPYTPPAAVAYAPAPVAATAAPAAVAYSPMPVSAPAPAYAAPVAATAYGTPAVTPVHYDPGPMYQIKVQEAERPVGAPRCFGDYNPTVHQCRPCPQVVDCQLKLLSAT